MTGLPRSVADALHSVTHSQRALAYLQIDDEFKLIGAGGNLENYGLGAVQLGGQAFEQAAQRYVDFYLAHMALEEQQILPLAERVLTTDDWADLDQAFLQNRDPLTGHEPEEDYRALFTRIVNLVPAPIGLGPER